MHHQRIVLIGQDQESLGVIEAVLWPFGYEVSRAEDPVRATRLLADATISAVIADLELGCLEPVPRWERRREDRPRGWSTEVTDGYALLRNLGTTPRPVEGALAWLRLGETRLSPHRFGVIDCIAKPVRQAALVAGLREVFGEFEPEPVADVGGEWRQVGSSDGSDSPSERVEMLRALDASREWILMHGGLLPPRSAPSAAVFDAVPRGLRTALVADSRAEDRERVRAMLAPYGFTLHQAADGRTALELAIARRPWFVLTDADLEGLSGVELTRQIRQHRIVRQTPVVFLSSWDDFEERERALAAGAEDYVSKSAPDRELLIRLQLVLKHDAEQGQKGRTNGAIGGLVEVVGSMSILQMCSLNRLSGTCVVRSGDRVARVVFREGEVLAAQAPTARGPEAIYELVGWKDGRFEFMPGDPGLAPGLGQTMDEMLLEGCRRLDEAQTAAANRG